MLRKVLGLFVGLGLVSGAFAQVSQATRSVDIRAGVLLVKSQLVPATTEPANNNPYLWYCYDFNRDIKPAGWNIYNPVAPTSLTPEIFNRWNAINVALGGAGTLTLGQTLTKRDAAYWEVNLSTVGDQQLASLDLLALSLNGDLSLNPDEREKLRKFMEGGGVLWVDVSNGASIDIANQFPLGFGLDNVVTGASLSADTTHPLMSYPQGVSYDNLRFMQSESVLGVVPASFAALGFGAITNIQSPIESDTTRLYPVAVDSRGAFVLVGQVGDGFLVVTSRGIHRTLNRVVTSSGAYNLNLFSTSLLPAFDRSSDAASRLATNIIHMTSGFMQGSKGSRQTNAGPIDIGAPLLKTFDANLPLLGANNYTPPVVFKGMVAIVANNRVYVYDSNPKQDLDSDGNSDDGVQDYALGSNEDLIWSSNVLSGPISAPTCVEVPNSGVAVNQLALTDYDGNLLIYDMFPATATANMAPVSTAAAPVNFQAFNTTEALRGPYAPTFHDGLYFVADEITNGFTRAGRIWIADARDGQVLNSAAPWTVGGSFGVGMSQPSSSPTVGYIPIADGSGGLDRVVYQPTRPNTSLGLNAGLYSVWVGAKGEKPVSFSQVGSVLQVQTRANLQGLEIAMPAAPSPLGLKISLIDDITGIPYNTAQLDATFTGAVTQAGGVLSFTLKPAVTIPANVSVRIDYTLDWGTGAPSMSSQLIRGLVLFPDDSTRSRRVLHNVALSPKGTVHAVVGNQTQGGTLYSLREETGRGRFKLINRYDLYPRHTFNINSSQSTTYAETLTDNDAITRAGNPFVPPGILDGPIGNLTFKSGPTVFGDTVYVMAAGNKRTFVPTSIVMAFQADPEAAEISVPGLGSAFTLIQPDFARSDNDATPTVFSTLTSGQVGYDAASGKIRIENLSVNQNGVLVNSLSRSQPVILRVNGQPDRLIEPDRSSSRWNPLLWYVVVHGYQNSSPALVTGNTLFFAARSVLPDILSGVPFGSWQQYGLLFGMDSQINSNDTWLGSDTTRPWLRQLYQLEYNPTFASNPAIRWPQTANTTTFEQYRYRLFQTILGTSNDGWGVVGGDGTLFGWGPQGVYGFTKADFIVVDEGRVAKFDPIGNPLWSSDSSNASTSQIDVGGTNTVRNLVRPSRAYSLNSREFLIVDPGANRVLRKDISGREGRSITGFHLDPLYGAPDGFSTNSALTLNEPRDAIMYTSFQTNPTSMSNARPLEYWVHYVIADSGNKRLIELIDRYEADPVTRRVQGIITETNGTRALGVLYWHSPASYSGKRFDYNSIARTLAPSLTGNYVYVAGIGSVKPTRADTGLDSPTSTSLRESGSGEGGIVVMDDFNTAIINEVTIPTVLANAFWNNTTNSFNSAIRQQTQKRIGNLTSVSVRNVNDPIQGLRVAIMFTDETGVYEIIQPAAVSGTIDPLQPWVVRWMLPREAFIYMRRDLTTDIPSSQNPRDFRPMYARRLDSGEVVVVNGYNGLKRNGSEYLGEVLEVDGTVDQSNNNALIGFGFGKTNLGFNVKSIKFELPPVIGARGIVLPVFGDRR